jgi:DNA-binding transcriptional ArsR family regulator
VADCSAAAERSGRHSGRVNRSVDPCPELSALAAVLADRTRASFCLAVLDGRAWTSGELARHAGVARSTASEHLDRLVSAGLLVQERQGRHRYVRLADTQTAELIESMVAHARVHAPVAAPRSLRAASAGQALARARTCYDHLAGALGVGLADVMTQRGLLQRDGDWLVTGSGLEWLADLGVDLDRTRGSRRPFARPCLDWTERRPHLAGAAAAAICERFFAVRWIERIGSGRAVRLTPTGRRGLTDSLRHDF